MPRSTILYAIIGFLLGFILAITLTVYAVNNRVAGMMRAMGMHCDEISSTGVCLDNQGAGRDMMKMQQMLEELRKLRGDNFDSTFMDQMIDHHREAVDMSKLALTNSKHEELKNLAQQIINSQQKEIDQMRSWQKQWDY